MNRQELSVYIGDVYDVKPEYPWIKYPGYEVFRHRENKKWFALIMNVSKANRGLNESGEIDILNVKCSPVIVGELLSEKGFFPAYHMNKNNWISVLLDGSVSDVKIKTLLDISFEMTLPKPKKKR